MLRELGLAGETIGFEKSYVSAGWWEEMAGLFPQARIVDSTELMDRVRWIKTPEEVAALEAGARLLDEAYLEVLPTVRPGGTPPGRGGAARAARRMGRRPTLPHNTK